MRLQIGLVTENTSAFLNQVKLCLFSLRKNGGKYKKVPVTLVINATPLSKEDTLFFKKQFSPIEFVTMPRLGGIPHTSKLNVFYAIDPSEYEALLFLDCDTLIVKPLDDITKPIEQGYDFVCRRGGETDRNRFVNFDKLVKKYCGRNLNKIQYQGENEWPMFNSGVFIATASAVRKIRGDSIDIAYAIFNSWQRVNALENITLLKYLYTFRILKSNNFVLDSWPIEQGALALSCIKAKIRIKYLDEKYNSWGNLDNIVIVHCFKSAYKFKRETMLTTNSKGIIDMYENDKLLGKQLLAKTLAQYSQEISR